MSNALVPTVPVRVSAAGGGVAASGVPASSIAANGVAIETFIAEELVELKAIRRDLHSHPELSFQERRTAGVVARELAKLGIAHKVGLGADMGAGGSASITDITTDRSGTGIVGYLPASTAEGNKLTAVGLRADMDALPILEATGKEYSSVNPGVMHACGHDGHTTMLIGAARVLSRMHRPRPVTFVFQPAEEGGGGAEVMCKQGCLEGGEVGSPQGGIGNPVGAMFGLHGWPTFDVGRVASKAGPLLAATDEVEITIIGTQAHGAYPHFGNDPIVAAAHVVVALQTVASRNVGPLDSVVVTVGKIEAGTASNIIPERASMLVTVRTLRAATRALAKERVLAIVQGTAAALGCRAEITYNQGYPATINDSGATEEFFAIAGSVIGVDATERIEQATMGGEDFAYYGQAVPACFFFLGLKPADAATCPTLHQPDFDFNDEAIETGVRLMCELATRAESGV